MTKSKRLLLMLVAVAIVLGGYWGLSSAQQADHQKKLLLRFHSFPMNPGEKVVGTLVTVSNGEIVHVSIPRGWNRQYSRTVDRRHSVHCSSSHATYGISASGKMPVLSILDKSSNGKPLTIEASVEIESPDGKKYSKQIPESEMSIQ